MSDVVKILALGGLDENGRDCYVVEINDDIFVLDAGTCLPDKTVPGVDYMIPNPDYLIKNKNRIKAYIITHGHDESMSALKYFYYQAPAPVYGSKETLALLVGQALSRRIDFKIKAVEVLPTSSVQIAGREVRFFQTCHNTVNSSGVAIWTDQGWVVYTSDYIIDFVGQKKGYYFDLPALEEISKKPTYVLMAESKTATKPGYCSPRHRTLKILDKCFKEAEKRIFISCFWQNIYRIEEIFETCKKYKKKVFFYNEFTRSVINLGAKTYPELLHDVEIVDKENFLRVRDKDLVILLVGLDEELYLEMSLLGEHANSDKRIVLGEEDLFINVALPRPTLETICTRAMDKIYRTGCQVEWVKSDRVTSMHAREDDLKFFISVLKPKYYLPVRGNFINMMANAKLALMMNVGLNHSNVFVMDNGMELILDGISRPRLIPNEANHINIEPILIDGIGVSHLGNKVVDDRLTLSQGGVVVIAATVNVKEKKIVAGPDCQMRGFVFVKEAEPLLKSLSTIFVDEINTAFQADSFDIESIYANAIERSERFIKRENGREPCILPIIDVIE